MDWKFRADQPIYTQLTARLAEKIVAGAYAPGERLPSVRDLAVEAGVNPNTVQRSLADLEREGLVFSQRTNGRFVTENTEMIRNARFRMADERVAQFLADMRQLGCTREEVIEILKEAKEKTK